MAGILPGWEIVHTGGGIYVAVRDFPLAGGGMAAVTVTDDTAAVHGRPSDGGLLTKAEWLKHEEAEEEVIGWIAERGGAVFTPGAKDLLGEEALKEIARAMDCMAGLEGGAEHAAEAPAGRP